MTTPHHPLFRALLRIAGSVAIAGIGISVLVASWPASSPRLAERPSGPRTETLRAVWTPYSLDAHAEDFDFGWDDRSEPPPGGDGGKEPVDPPEVDPAPPEPDPVLVFRTFVVREDDSLWKIAEEQLGDGMRYQDIESWNPQIGGRVLRPGMKLRLQVAASSEDFAEELPSPRVHTVSRGENLTRIGKRYGTTPEAIFRANEDRLESPDRIREGIELRIPEEGTR